MKIHGSSDVKTIVEKMCNVESLCRVELNETSDLRNSLVLKISEAVSSWLELCGTSILEDCNV